MLDGVALILGTIQSYVIYGIRRKANRALSGTRIPHCTCSHWELDKNAHAA